MIKIFGDRPAPFFWIAHQRFPDIKRREGLPHTRRHRQIGESHYPGLTLRVIRERNGVGRPPLINVDRARRALA